MRLLVVVLCAHFISTTRVITSTCTVVPLEKFRAYLQVQVTRHT